MARIAFMLAALAVVFSGTAGRAAEPISFGEVHFENSCEASVQGDFERAVALLHSFEFGESEQEFRKVERGDPGCVIAAWGVALANTQRSGPDISAKELAAGWKELEPWLKRPARTEREQLYVNAVSAIYVDYQNASGEVRWNRYTAQMRRIHENYPRDVNASLFYALALLLHAGAGREGMMQRKAALKILLPIFASHPDHPGAAHYIIHAADTPSLAVIALPAARRYASIAPSSPHALHMPSHIFNRLGYWDESIRSNIASARVAAEWVKDGRDGVFDELHALNNLEYGYLQLGQDAKAQEVMERIAEVVKPPGGDPWAPIDARIYLDVETHHWEDGLKVEAPPDSPFEANFDVYWMRSIAAAHLKDARRADEELDKFRRSSEDWTKKHGFADILHIALLQAEGWTLLADGKETEAVSALRSAVAFEQEHPLYYADVLPRPSSEVLGDMFAQLQKPSEALEAYSAALKAAPGRLDSLMGAQQAAERAGKKNRAQWYAKKIVTLGVSPSIRR
jgi:hypothetical protein